MEEAHDAVAPACPGVAALAARHAARRAADPGSAPAPAPTTNRSILAPARTRTCRSSTRGSRSSSPTTRSSSSSTSCSSASARTSSRCPGFADTWTSSERQDDPHVPHPRRHEVVGRRAGDVRGRALHLPARPRRGSRPRRATSARATSSLPDQRRPRSGRRARRQTLVATTEFPTTLLTQAYVPILPKHIWAKYTLEQIGNAEAEATSRTSRRSSGPARTSGRRVGAGRVHPLRPQPELLGRAGCGRRDHLPAVRRARTRWSRRCKNGELDYVRGVGADQFDALAAEPNIGTVEGFANGYTVPVVQHRRQQARATTARPRRSRTRRSATRSATRSTARRSSTASSTATASPGSTHVPPYHVELARRADHAAHLQHRRGERRLDAAGYARGADGNRARQGGQADQPAPDVAGLRGSTARTPSSSRAGSADRHQRRRRVTEEGKLLDDLLGPSRDGRRELGLLHVGLGRRPRPDVAARRSSRRTDRRAQRLLLLERRSTTSCSTLQQRGDRRGRAQGDHRRDAEAVLRRPPYHILYYDSELHA